MAEDAPPTGWKLTPFKIVGLAAGILVFILIAALDTPLKHVGANGNRPAFAAAVAALMAIWWLTEALPITVTALVPVVLYPVFQPFKDGLGDTLRQTQKAYLHSYIFLFAGGMCIGAAMQQCGLHRRIALSIMRAIGASPPRLLLGVLVATAFISLWISNTATAAMMMPIGVAIIAQLEARNGGSRLVHYGAGIMLAIAYAANIGGIGTKIGTAPNAQFAGFMLDRHVHVTFLKFMVVGLPFVVFMLPVVWWRLWSFARKDAPHDENADSVVAAELASLGPMQKAEKAVLAVFVATAALWISGAPITEGLTPHAKALLDYKLTSADVEGGIAVLAALVLIVMRVGGRATLGWTAMKGVPWDTLLLLGGGFAMAAGIEKSGLSDWMAMQLKAVQNLAAFPQILLACVVTVALTAVASNTATIGVMLSVLWSSVSPENRLTVLFAATIAASCDFALPAGTPPNAIVFGSGYVTVPRMAKTGVVLDLISAVVAALWCWLIVRVVF